MTDARSHPDAPASARRPLLAVVGSSGVLPHAVRDAAYALGLAAVDAGFRIVCGGRDGVMEAVCQGGRASPAWRDGTLLGLLPGLDADAANPWVDISLPTGLGLARNALVVSVADVVVGVRGASGTLSELAYAWQFAKPVIALTGTGGWSDELAGRSLGHRQGGTVQAAESPERAVALAVAALGPRAAALTPLPR